MIRFTFALLACCSAPRHPGAGAAPMVAIAAGPYIAGSTADERARAYDDYERTSGKDVAREHRWFDNEDDRHTATLGAFLIDRLPVTQGAYAEFVRTGGALPPAIDLAAWQAQGFQQDYATVVARDVWRDGRPPPGRAEHPVTLITAAEAAAYCAWRGRRLPTEGEYEKAARGAAGVAYPWGDAYEPDKLDSAVSGPHDTVPVGRYPAGASPLGVQELAGNVFEWTSSRDATGAQIVKGSAFEDWAGVGRGASRHTRAKNIRHIIIGFRCAGDAA